MNLKKYVFALAVTMASASAVMAQGTISLDECLKIALSENPTVRVADMEVKRMDYSKKEVIGRLLPTIDFGTTYNRTLEKQVMYMNMDDFGGMGGGDNNEEQPASRASRKSGNGGIKVGLDNSWSIGFQASLPLISPQLWKSIKISDTQILRSLESSRQSRQNLINQVKNAYYALLLAEDSRKVIQESYDMAALTHDTYTKQFEAGAASDYDVLRTSVAMKNIEPELLQADVAIRQARLQLLVLMGIEADTEIHPSTRLSDYEGDMYENALTIDSDYSGNADLRLLDIDAKLLKQQLDAEKLSFSPTLSLTANYNWTSMSNGSPLSDFRWSPYSSAGLTLSLPLFHGGQRWNRVKQAKIQADEIAWQRSNLERTINMQVAVATDNIRINVKQIASCSESVAEADRAHSIMEQSFAIGAASYLDLRDSELSLTRARLSYYQAIYNYLVAGSNLELLLGNAPIEKYTTANPD